MYSCASRASHRCTVVSPNTLPGQTRRPDPNGASLKSEPIMLTSSSRNRSGRKAHGSFHMDPSWVMAHMFTIAVVPAGTKNLSTWASQTANLAQESRGPGGCILRVSLTTAWRYRSFGISASDTGDFKFHSN
ncbi:hypothetical protein ACMD2_23197 [Ananas comosus]|uniref:Uncharacterized protein n=1 Tax=Ananas comosus TaxID=4615 RepID=A0A199VKZ6_ANACO|nr:hypothetical protein ACMD2_23197 [Ananas comosus]